MYAAEITIDVSISVLVMFARLITLYAVSTHVNGWACCSIVWCRARVFRRATVRFKAIEHAIAATWVLNNAPTSAEMAVTTIKASIRWVAAIMILAMGYPPST